MLNFDFSVFSIEKKVELLVIGDAMIPMWCYCKDWFHEDESKTGLSELLQICAEKLLLSQLLYTNNQLHNLQIKCILNIRKLNIIVKLIH